MVLVWGDTRSSLLLSVVTLESLQVAAGGGVRDGVGGVGSALRLTKR